MLSPDSSPVAKPSWVLAISADDALYWVAPSMSSFTPSALAMAPLADHSPAAFFCAGIQSLSWKILSSPMLRPPATSPAVIASLSSVPSDLNGTALTNGVVEAGSAGLRPSIVVCIDQVLVVSSLMKY
ncbi:hypothetical protein D3C79_826360 [compost metagenome]